MAKAPTRIQTDNIVNRPVEPHRERAVRRIVRLLLHENWPLRLANLRWPAPLAGAPRRLCASHGSSPFAH